MKTPTPRPRRRADTPGKPRAPDAAPMRSWTREVKSTINDVARLAGVSKKTVSRVINHSPLVRPETRDKVAALIAELSYVPDPQARGLAFRKSFLIGLVYDNPNAPYVINIQTGVLDSLRGSGFELVVHPCDRKAPEFIAGVRDFAIRQKLSGVILLPPVSEDEELADMLRQIDCDYVRVASALLDEPRRMVVSSDREVSEEVAQYLASLGHTDIAIITGPATGFRSSRERRQGFEAALARQGLKLRREFVVEGRYDYDSGVSCGETLLRRKQRPTAIFACNDEMASGVYRAAHSLGVTIPDELSIIGFDDSPLAARLWPALTTVRQPIRDMGRRAAAMLLGERAPRDMDLRTPGVFVPHLTVRDSCRPPPG